MLHYHMTQKVRILLSLVLFAGTIISLLYLVGKGTAKEQEILESDRVANLETELKEVQNELQTKKQEVAILESKLQKKETEASNAKSFINDEKNANLPKIYEACVNNKAQTKPSSMNENDYLRYTTSLLVSKPDVKAYLEEEISPKKRRLAQIQEVKDNVVKFAILEVSVTEIFPECKSTTLIHKTFDYNLQTLTITETTP